MSHKNQLTTNTQLMSCFLAPKITSKDFSNNETFYWKWSLFSQAHILSKHKWLFIQSGGCIVFFLVGWKQINFSLGPLPCVYWSFALLRFCEIGSLIDFIFISMQIAGPSDGSGYITDYFGIRLIRLILMKHLKKHYL